MMPRKFDRILDDCLSRMDRGESLMDILAIYPAQAEILKPLILTAMLSRAIPQPVPGYTALRVGKNQLLAEMASIQAAGGFLEPKPVRPPREKIVDRWIGYLKQLQPAYRFAMLSMVIILTGGIFTLSASASGLADNIMHTLYYSFEQVGDLLLVKPAPPKGLGENIIFSSDYDLPDSPPDYSGDFKGLMVDEENSKNKTDQLSEELLAQIGTREYSLTDNYDEEEVDLVDVVIDEKDLEKEEKEDEKDLEKEEKEAEKEAEKDEKDAKKVADKEEKEDEKDKDK
jgi:hypothetical protein